jgi:hypothetical protein
VFATSSIGQTDNVARPRPQTLPRARIAIWVGGGAQIFNRQKSVLDAMGDQAAYIGPIGAGSIAKLVRNCTKHDPADFALRLLHKDEPRLGTRDSTIVQLLQVERAGIPPLAADPERIKAVRDTDKPR